MGQRHSEERRGAGSVRQRNPLKLSLKEDRDDIVIPCEIGVTKISVSSGKRGCGTRQDLHRALSHVSVLLNEFCVDLCGLN